MRKVHSESGDQSPVLTQVEGNGLLGHVSRSKVVKERKLWDLGHKVSH